MSRSQTTRPNENPIKTLSCANGYRSGFTTDASSCAACSKYTLIVFLSVVCGSGELVSFVMLSVYYLFYSFVGFVDLGACIVIVLLLDTLFHIEDVYLGSYIRSTFVIKRSFVYKSLRLRRLFDCD